MRYTFRRLDFSWCLPHPKTLLVTNRSNSNECQQSADRLNSTGINSGDIRGTIPQYFTWV